MDGASVIRELNERLTAEIVGVLRCKRCQSFAEGMRAHGASAEFSGEARDGQAHADMIAQRIVQLGGEPDYSPARPFLRRQERNRRGANLAEMIDVSLAAEQAAITSCAAIIRRLGGGDPGTRRVLEIILVEKRERAESLSSLLRARGGVTRRDAVAS